MKHQRQVRFSPYILLTALISVLLVSGSHQEVFAQSQGDVSLTVQAGFNGVCKDNHWFPVRITVENKGADLNARVQVSADDVRGGQLVYASDISLPNTSRKELFLYVSPAGLGTKLTASVMDGNRTLITTPVSINCYPSNTLIIGLLADDLSAFDALKQATALSGSTQVVRLQLADLPGQSQGWEALDALVVSGLDMGAISAAQRSALRAWLTGGGKLLIAGGPGWQNAAGGLHEFMPIDVAGTQNVDGLSELQNYFRSPIPLDGQIVLAVGRVHPEATVLVEQDGLPVLVQQSVGFGAVYYLAADPGLQPLSSWAGLKDVYSHLLGDRSLDPSWAGAGWDPSLSNRALSALPVLGIPPAFYVMGLLGLYVLIIGPLNYFVLRRIKRQELAWITIPALVIAFTGLGYFSGFLIRGTRPVLNRLSAWQAWDGVALAQGHALVGLYSPGRTKYVLQSGDSFLAYPFDGGDQPIQTNQGWTSLQQGTETLVPDLLVESGGMNTTALAGSGAALTFRDDLVIYLGNTAPFLTGKITNTSKYALRNAILVTPNDSRNLGDFLPGDSKQVQVSLSANPDGSDFYSIQSHLPFTSHPAAEPDIKAFREEQLLRAVLYPDFGKGNAGVYLMGWVEAPLLSAGLQAQESDSIDTTLYVQMLTPKFKTASTPVQLTAPLFIWDSSDPEIAPWSSGAEIPQNGYVLSFRLAAPLQYKTVKSLTLSLAQGQYSANTPLARNAFLWDWDRAAWVQIQKLGWADINIPDPASYVGPGAEIKLRIEPDPSANQNSVEVGSSYFTLVVQP